MNRLNLRKALRKKAVKKAAAKPVEKPKRTFKLKNRTFVVDA